MTLIFGYASVVTIEDEYCALFPFSVFFSLFWPAHLPPIAYTFYLQISPNHKTQYAALIEPTSSPANYEQHQRLILDSL